MLQFLLVALMGGIGSACRYGVALVAARFAGGGFPLGTLCVNLIGCAAAGALWGWIDSRGPIREDVRLAILTGFLGGFTTFSAFGLETMQLLQRGDTGLALLNAAVSLLGGLGMVWLGYRLTMG